MDEKLVLQLHERFQEMSSEELSAIWIENNRNEWADEAFEAIRHVLSERNEGIPEQREAPQPPQVPAWRQRKSRLRRNAALLFGGGLVLSILLNNVVKQQSVFTDAFVTGCFVASIVLLIASFAGIPEQREAPQPPQVPAWRQRKSRLRRNAALLFGGGLVLSILLNNVVKQQSVFTDAFVTGCFVASIVLLIASFAVKRPRD